MGLGNPGEVYAATRHNLGFRVVEALARRRGIGFGAEECSARIAREGELLLAQPLTFMNRSGYAVRCLAERHRLAPEAILVVYDDVNLRLGSLRLRARGGPGGHRGMESVIESLRSDTVARLRLGIAPVAEREVSDLSAFVLAAFEEDEAAEVEALVERATEAAGIWLREGAEEAARRCNTVRLPVPPEVD